MSVRSTRRKFIEQSIKVGIGLPLMGSLLSACSDKNAPDTTQGSTPKKLNILILGGTSFLGPHQIAYALERGHSVTTFTRGKTEPTIYKELFEQVTPLIGDRATDLSALENGEWDAVIDNSGHDVEWAKKSATLLKDKASLYLFTSSTGVYYPYLGEDIKEDTKLLLTEPEGIEDEEMKLEYWYGVMKSNSEIAVKTIFGEDRSIIVRPTYMVGPADKTNRFIHWPLRLAQGGEVLVPGKEADTVQYIDVRDVASWMIRLLEEKQTDTFNAVGPKQAQTMYEFVAEAQKSFNVDSTFVRIDDYDFLMENKIPYLVPWIMPEGNNKGSALINNEKGLNAGLTIRPLQESVKDTYEWWNSEAVTEEQRNQVEKNPEGVLAREQTIIETWKQHKS